MTKQTVIETPVLDKKKLVLDEAERIITATQVVLHNVIPAILGLVLGGFLAGVVILAHTYGGYFYSIIATVLVTITLIVLLVWARMSDRS